MTSELTRSRFESEARRLRPGLLRVAASIIGNDDDAADVVQETFLKLWFLRSKLSDYGSIDAPARVIVRNLSLNLVRDRRSRPFEMGEIPDMPDTEYEEDFAEELVSAIDSLPGTEQAVLRMKHLEGMETEEIAILIQSTPGAVRTALSRARRRIRELYTRPSL